MTFHILSIIHSYFRLCDLNMLYYNKKYQEYSESPIISNKKKQRPKTKRNSTFSTEDQSSSDTDIIIEKEMSIDHDLGQNLNEKLDRYWAHQIVNGLKYSDIEENDEGEKEGNGGNKRKQLYDEEMASEIPKKKVCIYFQM